MKDATIVYADIAKNVFEVLFAKRRGRGESRQTMNRRQFEGLAERLPSGSSIYIEACGSMHYWGRVFQRKGHKVYAIAPQHVRPYRQGQKSDCNDAVAIREASKREGQRFVAIKTTGEQDVQLLLRVRERLVQQRTQVVNQARGFLLEYGVVIPVGIHHVRRLSSLLEAHRDKATHALVEVIELIQRELLDLEERIKSCDRKIGVVARLNPVAKKVQQVCGVGPITAASIVAKGYKKNEFKNGREFSAALGLVPSHTGSGGKVKIGHITKCGDRTIRSLLVQGAHCALQHCKKKQDSTSLWARSLMERKGRKLAAVALANKNARLVWRLISDKPFELTPTIH